jgi:hypothetical protein
VVFCCRLALFSAAVRTADTSTFHVTFTLRTGRMSRTGSSQLAGTSGILYVMSSGCSSPAGVVLRANFSRCSLLELRLQLVQQ